MKKRIAIITGGHYLNRKGFFNAMLNRTKHLIKSNEFDVTVFQVVHYDSYLVKVLRHKKNEDRPSKVVVDGVTIYLYWWPLTFIDYVLDVKLNKCAVVSDWFLSGFHKRLREYDLIEAHTLECGMIALNAKRSYGIPYCITWHGTDIHTNPFINKYKRKKTIEIIENADMNFFVSNALMKTSDMLTVKGQKTVLYNGRDNRFCRYDEEKRTLLRKKYNTQGRKVVAYAGLFRSVKNILEIPNIFKKISEQLPDVLFWMIGDGKYMKQVKQLSEGLDVVFWGNQQPEVMPDFMNCIDVFILPSLNEGLPLTLVEALASGAKCVGSRVGGIPEVIGEENTFKLNTDSFVDDFASRVVELLKDDLINQTLLPVFDWEETAKKEIEYLKSILLL